MNNNIIRWLGIILATPLLLLAEWQNIETGFKTNAVKNLYTFGGHQFAYLANDEGVYRRSSGSQSWELVLQESRLQENNGFAEFFSFEDTLFLTNGLYSPDTGKTWQFHSGTFSYPVTPLQSDLFALWDDTLKVSKNVGDSWSTAFHNGMSLNRISVNRDTLYLGSWGTIFRSGDGGVTWDSITTGLPERNNIYEVVHFRDSIFVSNTDNGLYVSHDNGITWKEFYTNYMYLKYHQLRMLDGHLFALSFGGSVDVVDVVDSSFSKCQIEKGPNPYTNIHCVSFFDGEITIGGLNGVYAGKFTGNITNVATVPGLPTEKTTPIDWELVTDGLQRRERIKNIYTDEERIFIISEDEASAVKQFTLSNDQGWSFDSVYYSFTNEELAKKALLLGDTIYIENQGYPYFQTVSFDGGESWKYYQDTSNLFFKEGLNVLRSGDTLLKKVVDTLYYSNNNGTTWTMLCDTLPPRQLIMVAGDRIIGYTMELVNHGKVATYPTWESTDFGKNWTFAKGQPIYEMITMRKAIGDGTLVGQKREYPTNLFISKDDGATWHEFSPYESKWRKVFGISQDIIFAAYLTNDLGDASMEPVVFSTDWGYTWDFLRRNDGSYINTYGLTTRFTKDKIVLHSYREDYAIMCAIEDIKSQVISTLTDTKNSISGKLTYHVTDNALNLWFLADKTGEYSVSMFTPNGRIVKKTNGLLAPFKTHEVITLDGLAAGVYMITVDYNGEQLRQKITISK